MRPTCAVCGNEIPAGVVGWFCSERCDDAEFMKRREEAKKRYEDGRTA